MKNIYGNRDDLNKCLCPVYTSLYLREEIKINIFKDTREDRRSKASGMGAGIAIGVGVGVAMDNLAVGIAIGIAIGLAIGKDFYRKNKQEETK